MLILVVFSIVLMILDTRVAAIAHARNSLTVALIPLQYLVSGPIQFIGKVSNNISSHDALVKENMDLRAQQLLLKAQVQRLLALESENNQLKSLQKSSSQIQGKVLIAQLLAIDSDPFIHQVVLDKGARDDVFIGQPVLDANGVMGQIIQISPFTSRVLLINDPHSGVPVQIARNGLRAIAMGDNYTGKLRLVNVPQTADIKKGDRLMTSGLGDHYPEGYPVGVISSINQDPGLQFATITVEPGARLDRARQVLLVWPTKNDKKINANPVAPPVVPSQNSPQNPPAADSTKKVSQMKRNRRLEKGYSHV